MDISKTFSQVGRRVRRRRYGLPWFAFGGFLGAFAIVVWVIIEAGAPADDSVDAAVSIGWIIAAGVLYPLHERLARRQRREHLRKAQAAIAQTLRAELPDGRIVDFEPQYPAVWPAEDLVWAIDPKLRAVRVIMPHREDTDGVAHSEVRPFDVPINRVEISESARGWLSLFGFARWRPALSIRILSEDRDGKPRTAVLPFRLEDRDAANSWLRVFEQWHRDDQTLRAAPAV